MPAIKKELFTITLDDTDEPVIAFTHSDSSTTIDQKLLGALIRKIARQGIELTLLRSYDDDAGKTYWDYQIRAKRTCDETQQRAT